jgi:RNase P/RNase MRP subunit POP5
MNKFYNLKNKWRYMNFENVYECVFRKSYFSNVIQSMETQLFGLQQLNDNWFEYYGATTNSGVSVVLWP